MSEQRKTWLSLPLLVAFFFFESASVELHAGVPESIRHYTDRCAGLAKQVATYFANKLKIEDADIVALRRVYSADSLDEADPFIHKWFRLLARTDEVVPVWVVSEAKAFDLPIKGHLSAETVKEIVNDSRSKTIRYTSDDGTVAEAFSDQIFPVSRESNLDSRQGALRLFWTSRLDRMLGNEGFRLDYAHRPPGELKPRELKDASDTLLSNFRHIVQRGAFHKTAHLSLLEIKGLSQKFGTNHYTRFVQDLIREIKYRAMGLNLNSNEQAMNQALKRVQSMIQKIDPDFPSFVDL